MPARCESVWRELVSLHQQPVAGLRKSMQAALDFVFDPTGCDFCILAGLNSTTAQLSLLFALASMPHHFQF